MNTKLPRRLVVFQNPNPPIIGWFLVTVINFGFRSAFLAWLGSALLFTWAFLELWQGINWFRRGLGLIVLSWLVFSHLH